MDDADDTTRAGATETAPSGRTTGTATSPAATAHTAAPTGAQAPAPTVLPPETMQVPAWDAFRRHDNRNEPVRSTFSTTVTASARKVPIHHDSVFSGKKRLSPQERMTEITRGAADVISEKGFQGMSMQDVADRVGITEAALYHYVRAKADLLSLVLRTYYDSPAADDFIYGTCQGIDADGHTFYYFPRFCINIIVYNLRRPQFVKLFSILNGEALAEDHPAHTFFRDRNLKHWNNIRSLDWLLPQGYDMQRFQHLWILCMSAMDGLQYRWLMDDQSDLLEEWLAFSRTLFPQEVWGHLLDPTCYEESDGCLRRFGLLDQDEA